MRQAPRHARVRANATDVEEMAEKGDAVPA